MRINIDIAQANAAMGKRVILSILLAGALCAGHSSAGQIRRARAIPDAGVRRIARPNQARGPVQLAPDVLRARQLIGLFLSAGQRQAYSGEQTTRLLQGRVQESQQIVKHAGPGRERIEYTSPPTLRGEVLLMNGGRLLHYKPAQNTILDGPAPMEQFEMRVRQLLLAVRKGQVSVRAIGDELIAGQSAGIVEIRALAGGAFYKRLWIDEKTGVRLKMENLDPNGRVVSTSYFTGIDYAPNFASGDFRPDSLPRVPHQALLPQAPPLPNVQAAQQQVGYAIKEPVPPAGFRLDGVWAVAGPGGRHTVILRYTDGVNTFALFQHPLPPRQAAQQNPKPKAVRLRQSVAHWATSDRVYTLIGSLRQEALDQIMASLQ